ncbi:hypothetical protein EVAR_87874_1 [Eumeta japonica]|uniref:Uncharacterized protein n=1 Tax=Eumeta variegata TaxID=151549 RepID=A0A4C1WU12_EUMVA|nr:hypothetical protein EVAR_87874_1 [Eumeta japonica]
MNARRPLPAAHRKTPLGKEIERSTGSGRQGAATAGAGRAARPPDSTVRGARRRRRRRGAGSGPRSAFSSQSRAVGE